MAQDVFQRLDHRMQTLRSGAREPVLVDAPPKDFDQGQLRRSCWQLLDDSSLFLPVREAICPCFPRMDGSHSEGCKACLRCINPHTFLRPYGMEQGVLSCSPTCARQTAARDPVPTLLHQNTRAQFSLGPLGAVGLQGPVDPGHRRQGRGAFCTTGAPASIEDGLVWPDVGGTTSGGAAPCAG